uniref:Baculoviridae p74 N-terminal domain-containing protein n=1 Tax=Faxonius propinquus nudivirus TaxID=3139431 RepID=A0AAU8GBM1_9VIRU
MFEYLVDKYITMSYTSQDINNAIMYSNQRILLRTINLMYDQFPHITSHIDYEIIKADSELDYYYPLEFSSKAILVKIKLNKKVCNKLSCNSSMQWSTCLSSTQASYYRIGDQPYNFERHCQPACFHLNKNITYDEVTGQEQVQMMRLDYVEKNGCIIVPPGIVWNEFPYYRSSEHFEQRVNDLPVGFNRAINDEFTYSGRNYEYNKSYCDAFFDTWDDEKKTCVTTLLNKFLYAVVGEQIIKIAKAGVQLINSGGKSDYPPLPSNLPEIPEIEPEWLLENWTTDIDNNFINPNPDFKFTEENKTIKSNIILTDFEERIKLLKYFKMKQLSISSKLRRKLENSYSIKITENEEINFIRKKNHSLQFKRNVKDSDANINISEIITALFDSLLTSSFWLDIGIGIFSDVAIDQIKLISKKIANELIPKLTATILNSTTKFFTEVLTQSIFTTIASCTSKIIIKSISTVMIKITQLLAEMASVIGWILIVVTIFDILLSFWDPLGFSNKFNAEILTEVMRNSDTSLRMQLQVATPTMNFDILSNLLLSDTDIINTCIASFNDIYSYLDSLTINSEGSRIYKGVIYNNNNPENIDSEINQNIVATKLYTSTDFFNYEKTHAIRLKYFTFGKKIIFWSFVAGSCFLLINLYVIAILCFFICFLAIFSIYINIDMINLGKYIEQIYDYNLLLPYL